MKRLLCFIFNHQYKIDVYFGRDTQKLKCERCGKMFGINYPTKTLLEWDDELEDAARLVFPNNEYFTNKS